MAKKARRLTPISEHHEQAAVVAWARLQARSIPALSHLFSIPNAARRSFWLARRVKAEGLEAGVPDLLLAYPDREHHHGLFIEMKAGRNKSTPMQSTWQERLASVGYVVRVCYSADEAIREIRAYLSA